MFCVCPVLWAGGKLAFGCKAHYCGMWVHMCNIAVISGAIEFQSVETSTGSCPYSSGDVASVASACM